MKFQEAIKEINVLESRNGMMIPNKMWVPAFFTSDGRLIFPSNHGGEEAKFKFQEIFSDQWVIVKQSAIFRGAPYSKKDFVKEPKTKNEQIKVAVYDGLTHNQIPPTAVKARLNTLSKYGIDSAHTMFVLMDGKDFFKHFNERDILIKNISKKKRN